MGTANKFIWQLNRFTARIHIESQLVADYKCYNANKVLRFTTIVI